MVYGAKEPFDIRIQYPAYLSDGDHHAHGIQRLMLRAAGPKPVAETEEITFVDRFKDPDQGLLDNLVFNGGDADRTQFAVGLGEPDPFDVPGFVTVGMDSAV